MDASPPWWSETFGWALLRSEVTVCAKKFRSCHADDFPTYLMDQASWLASHRKAFRVQDVH